MTKKLFPDFVNHILESLKDDGLGPLPQTHPTTTVTTTKNKHRLGES